jgi:hypothetical protein
MYGATGTQELTDQRCADAEWLEDHLVHDHDRRPHEIAGLPLRAVHELEHVEDSMGLLDLHHRHGV